MAAYDGYLLKFGSHVLPNSFIQKYNSKPNQRLELSAERDGNAYLHRETSPNYKSTVKPTIMPLYDGQLELFKAIVADGMVNERERKVHLTYWNVETQSYKSGDFYIPDIEYTVKHITDDGQLVYEGFEFELIEY